METLFSTTVSCACVPVVCPEFGVALKNGKQGEEKQPESSRQVRRRCTVRERRKFGEHFLG